MRRIALSRYLIEEQREKHWIEGDLRLLIEVVARACKSIASPDTTVKASEARC